MPPVNISFVPGNRLIDGTDLNTMVQQVNNALAAIGPTSGPVYFVNATIGNDGATPISGGTPTNLGTNPAFPLATIARALVIESAALTGLGLSAVGRNAVIAFWGTQSPAAAIAWNLPGTHLIGIGAPSLNGKSALITAVNSPSGTTGPVNLLTITASGCYFANFATAFGFSNTSTALVAISDTAGGNCFNNCELNGFGDATVTTGTAVLTGAAAFEINVAGIGDSFYNCSFGTDTLSRNATNYTFVFAGGTEHNYFENCEFAAKLGSSGTAASHIHAPTSSCLLSQTFKGCRFYVDYVGSTMAQALSISVTTNGAFYFDQCTAFGAITALQTSPTANCTMNMVAATSTGGVSHEIF